ncbi:Fasciclin-like arabinogalactan protein 19 [Raphanus sativus]|uniref:Fasciclin-like arabinogalactan protein 19 n=1 Tax=Raphanus sativus TaxID=3726 RepID=A0A6J0KTR7_RAPSA|nr:fasciclin-like arabinogalactan protein 19 [Raphanus sativus]KAJ4879341.1 Fasciclin-like arabinogalactan protein 19 [Raphanus sativus]
MATISLSCAVFLAALILCFPRSSAGVPLEEFERAITVLRVRGRALFANAIITSDLLFDLLSVESLTLFVPTDSMLFDLDMTHSSYFYVSTLRLHSVPLRLPFSDLRSLPNATSLPTLLPSHHIRLTTSDESIFLDGVPVLLPDLFYGEHLAVHGLAGLISLATSSSPELSVHLPPPVVVDSPAESPYYSRFSPAPQPYDYFLGLSSAEATRVEDVSPSPWRDGMIVGDEGGPLDWWSNHF